VPTSFSIAALTLVAVLLTLAGETVLSAFNERALRSRGFREAGSGEAILHALMRWCYPACFMAMTVEGAVFGPAPIKVLAAGLAIFGMSKALKMWCITTLGVRWTYRVLVHPGHGPITHGPYAFVRHPNYLAVIGEMIGVALIVWAPCTGVVAIAGYGTLLGRKIALEDQALGRQ
jgi:methyltransferase